MGSNPTEATKFDYGDDMHDQRIVAISGGFDPLTEGHLDLMRAAAAWKEVDGIQVYVNVERDLVKKKGFHLQSLPLRMKLCFYTMVGLISTENRGEGAVMKSLIVVPVIDNDGSVIETLRKYRPTIFANGGDRKDESSIPESDVCKELGIEMAFGVGSGKVGSSSNMFHQAVNEYMWPSRPTGRVV